MSIEEKIHQLFHYRKLDYLLSQGHYGTHSPLCAKLIDLQKAIYDLDDYLETHWDTNSSKLDSLWNAIKKQLWLLGIPQMRIEDYLSFIIKYQKHELVMRNGKLPTSLSLPYYYFYKSCDVKLIRRIIYDYIPSLGKIWSLTDWREFDLITEVNDDIEDVFEDTHIINGNYFLLSLKEEGKGITKKAFVDFLNSQFDKAQNRARFKQTADQNSLFKWTEAEYRNTLNMLSTRLQEVNQQSIKKPNS